MRLERSTDWHEPGDVSPLPPPPLPEDQASAPAEPGPGGDPESLTALVAAVIGATGLLTEAELAAVRAQRG